MPIPPIEEARARSGRCAIVGRPNVGKSTLLNAMLGQRLAITTSVPGTTRSCLLGIYASEAPPTQIAFIDTPGLSRPRDALGQVLRDQADIGMADVDVILVVVEAPRSKERQEIHPEDALVLERVEQIGKPTVLAINKVDRLRDRKQLLPWIATYTAKNRFADVVPVSATKGDGIDRMIEALRVQLPEGLLYDEDTLTDRPERFFAAEMVREAAMRHTRAEVPHGIACLIDRYEEEPDRSRIHATLIVDRPGHKAIVIGKGGQMIKQIGIDARKSIEAFLDKPVVLKLWVKVIAGWTKDPVKARQYATEVDS